jgi:polygalacturonase
MRKTVKVVLLLLILAVLSVTAYFIMKKSQPSPVSVVSKVDNEDDARVPFDMPEISKVSIPDRVCDISMYGAVGDGKTLDTQAFSRAITDCNEKGGGKVIVPRGTWFTGAIHLLSNVELHLEKGSEIVFSSNIVDYQPAVFSRFEGIELYNYSPLIYVANSENIAITGEGVLNGNAEKWFLWNEAPSVISRKQGGKKNNLPPKEISSKKIYEMGQNGTAVEERMFGNGKEFLQPSFLEFVNCKKISIEGIKMTNSPSWTIHPIYSSDITIKNISIDTDGQNTDGIAVDSSRNILIEDSFFHAGDDAISIKSGKDRDGWRVGKPSENIIVRNCSVNGGHSAVAFGSEMSGDIRNVFVYNTDVNETDYGIRFKTMRGRGGVIEKIWVRKIAMDRITLDALQMEMNYRNPLPGYDKQNVPIIRDIEIKDITCKRARNAATLDGLSESPLEKITLEDFKIFSKGGIISNNVKIEKYQNIEIRTEEGGNPEAIDE